MRISEAVTLASQWPRARNQLIVKKLSTLKILEGNGAKSSEEEQRAAVLLIRVEISSYYEVERDPSIRVGKKRKTKMSD